MAINLRNYHPHPQAVDLEGCIAGDKARCNGADSSILLSVDEMTRPENGHDDLSQKVSKPILHIAQFYGISVADALAVSGIL
jgi:hypothetical protein